MSRLRSSKIFLSLIFSLNVMAQETPSPVMFGAFLDTYTAFQPRLDTGEQRAYTTQAYENEELQINLAHVESKFASESYRARLAAQYGTSVDANYAAEPQEFWKYIQEANAGVELADGVWLDAGIHFSHIGLETWISRDNWAYTRSLISEFSPYYQLGGKLSMNISSNTELGVYLLNGWQNISDGRHPALGIHLAHSTEDYGTVAYNNFIGKEQGTRVFNDFVYTYEVTKEFRVATAIDVGFQDLEEGSGWWNGIAALARYGFTDKLAITTRLERFFDPHGVVAASVNENSFNANGASLGIDYALTKDLLFRGEWKVLVSNSDLFPASSSVDRSSTLFVVSLSYYVSTLDR